MSIAEEPKKKQLIKVFLGFCYFLCRYLSAFQHATIFDRNFTIEISPLECAYQESSLPFFTGRMRIPRRPVGPTTRPQNATPKTPGLSSTTTTTIVGVTYAFPLGVAAKIVVHPFFHR